MPAPVPAPDANETTRSLKLITEYVGPINAAILMATTAVDLASPHLAKASRSWLALCIGLTLVAMAFRLRQLARRCEAQGTPRSPSRLFLADRRHWLLLAALVLGLLGLRAQATAPDSRGALAQAVPGLADVQDALGRLLVRADAIQADTSVIRAAVAPQDAAGRLRVRGYGLDPASKARALEACDLAAVRDYLALGEALPLTLPVMGQRGGSTLEFPLLAQDARLPEVIALLAPQHPDWNALQPLTFTQAMTRPVPHFEAFRHRLTDPIQRLALSPSTLQASPLAVALWFGSEAAARALLTAGASPSATAVAALLPVVQGGVPTGGFRPVPLMTARELAAQMQRTAWLQ